MGASCSDNWYTSEFYDGEIFAALQPKKMVCHKVDGASSENVTAPSSREFAITMLMMLYLGSIVILLILYRSCSRKRSDAFRLIFIYLIGTVGVALSLNFGPKTGGFTRLIAWGVLVHNLAEWLIITRLWYGERYINALPALLYASCFMILIVFTPLIPLWFFGMFQGAVCDYILVYTMLYFIRWTGKQEKLGIVKSRRKYMCAGAWGAIIHIISIQPLFYGMATAYSPLMYMTTLFILPSFILYTYWASGGRHKANLVKPDYDKDEDESDGEEIEIIFEKVAKRYKSGSGGNDNALKLISVEEEKSALINSVDDNNGKNRKYKDIMSDVIEWGIVSLDPSVKPIRNKIFFAGFLTSLLNSICVFMAPCYLDLSGLIDCNSQ